MQAQAEEEIVPRDPNKTYSLMAIVEGESLARREGPRRHGANLASPDAA